MRTNEKGKVQKMYQEQDISSNIFHNLNLQYLRKWYKNKLGSVYYDLCLALNISRTSSLKSMFG